MNETIRQYRDRLLQYWSNFNRTQKILLVSIAVLTVLTIALLIYHFSKTEYSLAYTNLTPADAAAIKNYLDSAGIPYKFSQDGTSVGVPSTHVADVKIAVESQNLLNGGSIGYGIFRENITSLGMTDNQFEILSVDAKAGEIEQLINSMNGVADSKVLLSIPKQSVFINENTEQASASVVVKFEPGVPVDQKKIDTIYNLVQKSVNNLPLENITISDQNGELLPSSKLNGGAGSAASIVEQQFQIKKQYEEDIRKNVERFLSRFFGPDKVIVSVVATLNFDQKNRQEKLFAPVNEVDQTGIERSVQEIQKTYTSEGGGLLGIAGTGEQDVPGYPGTAQGGNSSAEEIERIINYEVNEITNSIVSSPYVVKDLTISAGIEPPVPNDPASLPEEVRAEVERILVNIVGASLADSGQNFTPEQLNDKVSVLAYSFSGASALDSGASTGMYWLYALGGVALALAAIGGYAVYRRRKRESIVEEEVPVRLPEIPEIALESGEHQVRRQLEKLAKTKPEEFVNLLRSWLAEE